MLAEIGAGLSSLKAATDILKGLNATNTQVAINDVKLALQERIFEARDALAVAQDAQATALNRIRHLEQEIVELKDWKGEKQRYHLQAIDRGAVAYMQKPGMENGEPPHWLCANCFNRGQKSFLQFKGQDQRPGGGRGDHSTYGCDSCKTSFKVFYTKSPAAHAASQSAKAPGETCPSCGESEYRVERSEADPTFGELGGRIHHMKCGKCSFTDKKLVT